MARSIWLEMRELLHVIADRIPARTQFLDRSSIYHGDQDFAKLFRAIQSNRYDSEESLVRSEFGRSVDGSYRTLRGKLRQLALQSLFVLDLKAAGFSEYAIAMHNAARMAFMVRVLGMLGARRNARAVAVEAVELSTKYEFWLNLLEVLSFLRDDAIHSGEIQQHAEIAKTISNTIRKLELEEKAEALLGELQMDFVKSIAPKPHLAEKAHANATQVRQWATDVSSYRITLIYYRIQALQHQVAFNSEEALKTARECLRYIRSKPHFRNRARESEFALSEAVCLLDLGKYSEAYSSLTENEALVSPGSTIWFTWKEQELLSLLHSERFSEARDLHALVTSRPEFAHLQDYQREKWLLFAVYVQFALAQDLSHIYPTLQKLLDVAPSFAKDRAGYQVSLFLLHISLQLIDRQFNDALARVKALRNFASRYLKGVGAQDERIFIKLLELAAAGDLEVQKGRQAADRLVAKLEGPPGATRVLGPQILPYAYFWRRIQEAMN